MFANLSHHDENNVMSEDQPLFIPVILGTPRQGHMSKHVANLVVSEVARRESVECELIDVRSIPLTTHNEGGIRPLTLSRD